MEEFALYLFKSVVWLAGFTLVFILFLKNERFFLLNRIYLIAGILTSFILPLISIHYTVVLPAVASYQISSSVSSGNQIVDHSLIPDIKTILFTLYITGVSFVVLLAVRQGRSVFRAIKKSEVISLQPVKLIKTPEYTSAFSFFSYVFVNPSVTDVETKEIMIHELVHIRQKHWFDLLLVELLRTMQWFNPLVWIYVRFIRQNHEYLADEVALQQTSDPAVYKAVLLNQIVGEPVIRLTNSFNYSPNKKRFYMMKNIITSPYRKMKVLLILPVFALVLYSFAKPDYKYLVVKQSGAIADTTKKTNRWVSPLPPPPPPVPADLNSKELPTPPPSINENEPVPAPPPPPTLKFQTDGSNAIYVVDGVIVSKADAEKINPEAIESINVKKNKSATEKYGKKAKDGVIEITLKKNHKEFENAAFPEQTVPPTIYNLKDSGNRPLVIIDGKTKAVDVDMIEPETIESVSVLNDKRATDKYGEKAKDGVIEVKTKKVQMVDIRSENGVKPVVVVDGVIKDIEVNAIDPDAVETISVLKDNDATAKYGQKGKDGVIELVLKKDVQVNVQVEKVTEPVIVVDEVPVVNEVSLIKEVQVEKEVPVKK